MSERFIFGCLILHQSNMDVSCANIKKKCVKICECEEEFGSIATYYRHRKSCLASQNAALENKSNNFVCKEEICIYTAKRTDDFVQHLQNAHNIECSNELKMFCNFSEFESWKDDYEKKTYSSYVLRSNKKSTKGNIKYFYCNRSGFYESKSKRKRSLKSKGLTKIGSNCPSHIKLCFQNDKDQVTAYIEHTHYGHDNDLAHIRLPKSDRKMFASQLSQGCQISSILENLFPKEGGELQRKHLCTRRDLVNIAKTIKKVKTKKPAKYYFETVIDIEPYLHSPIMSDPDEPTEEVIDADAVLTPATVENSEMENIRQNLLQKTLFLFEKIQNISSKSALLTIQQHLNDAYSAAELDTVLEGEMCANQINESAADNTDEMPAYQINESAADNTDGMPANQLNESAADNTDEMPANQINESEVVNTDLKKEDQPESHQNQETIDNDNFTKLDFQEEKDLFDEILFECDIAIN